MAKNFDQGCGSRFGAWIVPVALLALPACSSVEDGDAGIGEDSGAEGTSGFEDGGAYTTAAGDDGGGSGDDGWDGDGGTGGDEDGGTGAGEDGGPDAPVPDEEDPMMPPEKECNDVDDVTLYLSPDDSNSMSSPVQLREAVLDGFGTIKAVPIRTYEFMNYYNFAYPAPTTAGDLTVTTDLVRNPEVDGEYQMQIGIASQEIGNDERDPIALTLVLDTSGSMQGLAMDMLKESCRAIAASLRDGDIVSMNTWDTQNSTVLGGYHVTGPNDEMVLSKCESLEAGGGTDLHGGLTAGYQLASDVYQQDMINRIVLISDGGANAGITDVEIIAEHTALSGADGIYMVGVGVGEAHDYNDDLMNVVTDAGKGASVFISDADEAWRVFNDRFVSTMAVAARDVQVRLDMPPGFEVVKFSGEEISGDPSEVEPQHLAPSDTMVFHQTIATCAPELVESSTELTVTVKYLDAKTFESKSVEHTLSFGEFLAGDHAMLLKGAAIFEYAEQLKVYQATNHDDEQAEAIAIATAALQAAQDANPGDPDLAEIATVLAAL